MGLHETAALLISDGQAGGANAVWFVAALTRLVLKASMSVSQKKLCVIGQNNSHV